MSETVVRKKGKRPGRKRKFALPRHPEAMVYQSLYWPVRLHRIVARVAKREGTSMNAVINRCIIEGTEAT